MIFETGSAVETFTLGERIGQKASPGQIYALSGDLGVWQDCTDTGNRKRSGDLGAGLQPYFYHYAEL